MKVNWPTWVKGPQRRTVSMVTVKKNFACLLRSRTYHLLSHFQNDGLTVECNTVTSPDSVCNSRVEEGLKKRSTERIEAKTKCSQRAS